MVIANADSDYKFLHHASVLDLFISAENLNFSEHITHLC